MRVTGAVRRAAIGGFTLIEMALVAVVLGIGITLVAVNLEMLVPSTKMSAASRRLVSILSDCRMHALTHSKPYGVELDLDGSRYRIVTPLRDDGVLALSREDRFALTWNLLPEGIRIESVVAGTAPPLTSGSYLVDFSPSGSAPPTLIYLFHQQMEKEVTLRLIGLTGRVDLHSGRFQPQVVNEASF